MEKRLKDVSNSSLRQERMAGSCPFSHGQAVYNTDGYISDSLFPFWNTLDFLHIERLTVAKLENRRVLVIECSF